MVVPQMNPGVVSKKYTSYADFQREKLTCRRPVIGSRRLLAATRRARQVRSSRLIALELDGLLGELHAVGARLPAVASPLAREPLEALLAVDAELSPQRREGGLASNAVGEEPLLLSELAKKAHHLVGGNLPQDDRL